MSINPRYVIFVVFIGTVTVISVIYEYNLKMKDVFEYMAIVVILTLIPAIGYYIITQIKQFKNRVSRPRILVSETVSTTSENSTNLSSTYVIDFLNRLATVPDFTLKTLPTYSKAITTTRPLQITVDNSPPPAYCTIPSNGIINMPPPNYDDISSDSINPSSNPQNH